MRTLQALLQAGLPLDISVIREFPTEYVQAEVRLQNRAAIPTIKKLRRHRQLRQDPVFLAFYGWAMYEFGEFDEVIGLSRALSQLQSNRGHNHGLQRTPTRGAQAGAAEP